jgi:hypothetical protein
VGEGEGEGENNEVRPGQAGVEGDTVTAAWGDVNGDGRPDLFVGNDGAANKLWLNLGNGTWKKQVGVGPGKAGTSASSYSAAWGDANGDGRLDLFVGTNGGSPNELWLNQADGTWVQQTGTGPGKAGTKASTLAAAWGDVNGDGRPDLFVGNYEAANELWLNVPCAPGFSNEYKPGGTSCLTCSHGGLASTGSQVLLLVCIRSVSVPTYAQCSALQCTGSRVQAAQLVLIRTCWRVSVLQLGML